MPLFKLLKLLPLAAFLLAAPAIAPAGAPAIAKEWTSITIATEGAFPPYNMHAPDGTLTGFEIDYAKVLCQRANLTCKVVAQDWDGIIPGLLAGKYDAIMAAMSITPKRMEAIAFTQPYVQSPTTFAINKDSGTLPLTGQRISLVDLDAARKQLEPLRAALKGKVIGVQVSTIQADLMNTFFKDVAEIRTYKTVEEHNLDLAAGRVDVVCSSAAVLTAALEKPGGDSAVIAGPLVSGGMTGVGSGIGLRKGDPELREKLDAAIKAAATDGTTLALYMKWFKLDLTPQ